MHAHVVKTGLFGPTLRLAPLQNGDTATVAALLPCLGPSELAQLAAEDARHHTVVAWVDGERTPAGFARLVRDGDGAEIVFAVSDRHRGKRVATTLARELLDDARTAGIAFVTATIDGSNRAALALLRRTARVTSVRPEGGALTVRASLY